MVKSAGYFFQKTGVQFPASTLVSSQAPITPENLMFSCSLRGHSTSVWHAHALNNKINLKNKNKFESQKELYVWAPA